jgi:excisionase family DNA binding protein
MMMGDAAKLLGVSRVTIWRMMKLGKLEGVEILPGTFRARRSDVEAIEGKAEG